MCSPARENSRNYLTAALKNHILIDNSVFFCTLLYCSFNVTLTSISSFSFVGFKTTIGEKDFDRNLIRFSKTERNCYDRLLPKNTARFNSNYVFKRHESCLVCPGDPATLDSGQQGHRRDPHRSIQRFRIVFRKKAICIIVRCLRVVKYDIIVCTVYKLKTVLFLVPMSRGNRHNNSGVQDTIGAGQIKNDVSERNFILHLQSGDLNIGYLAHATEQKPVFDGKKVYRERWR